MTPDTAALRARPVTMLPDRIVITAAERDALCDAADEVERWRSGQRVRVLPVLPEHPDALNLAAELLHKQTGEYEDTDATMRAAATVLRDVDQIARASRTAHAALIADLRALPEREWSETDADSPESRSARAYNSALAQVRALLDRHAPKEDR